MWISSNFIGEIRGLSSERTTPTGKESMYLKMGVIPVLTASQTGRRLVCVRGVGSKDRHRYITMIGTQ